MIRLLLFSVIYSLAMSSSSSINRRQSEQLTPVPAPSVHDHSNGAILAPLALGHMSWLRGPVRGQDITHKQSLHCPGMA